MTLACYNVGKESARAMLGTSASMAEFVTGLRENKSDMHEPTKNTSSSLSERIWSLALPPNEKYVLLAVAADAPHTTAAKVSHRTGYSERRARSILQSLQRRGVVTRVRSYGSSIVGSESTYTINIDAVDAATPFDKPDQLNKPTRRKILMQLYESQAGLCAYCRKPGSAMYGPDGEPWHIDRITPRALGGKYTEDNVALSCATCNRKKGKELPKNFR